MPFTRAYPFFEFFVHKLTERTILYITMDAKDTFCLLYTSDAADE